MGGKSNAEYFKKYYAAHRDQRLANQRKYNASVAGKNATANAHYIRKYGISLDEYNKLVIIQGGCCAICGRKTKYKLRVDHDHGTGLVRGLLCIRCNSLLDWSQSLKQQINNYLGLHDE